MNAWIDALNAISATWLELLLRTSWQGGIALAVVWLIARFVSRLPAAHKVWLWRLAFLKLLAGLVWLSPVALPVLQQQTRAVPLTGIIPTTLPYTEAAPDLPLPATTLEPTPSHLHFRGWLFVAWCGALFICAVRVLRHWRDTRRLLRGSRSLAAETVEECVRTLSQRLHLRRPPSVHESSTVSSPVLVGIFRPQIILPRGLADSVLPSRLELMLAHELAHLRRRDLLWLWLFTLGETVFFFHPLVWLARREWTLATEAACDEMAIRLTRQTPRDYGEMLVDIVAATSRCSNAAPLVAVGIIENAHTLKRRLKLMITTRTRFASIGGIALIFIATLALVPWKLTAQDADAEAVAKLKEENARLRQELEAIRRDAEKMRADSEQLRKRGVGERQSEEATLRREAERENQLAREQARNAESQKRAAERVRADQQRVLQLQAELDKLRTQFTENHPRVREVQAQLERLEAVMEATKADRSFESPLEPKRDIRATNERAMRRQEQQRALLQKELELVEREVEMTRKEVEAGVQSRGALLAAQRELLDVKLQLAKAAHSQDESRAVIRQQIDIANKMLKEQKQLVERGVAPVASEIQLEREVLRLTRKLHELDGNDSDQ